MLDAANHSPICVDNGKVVSLNTSEYHAFRPFGPSVVSGPFGNRPTLCEKPRLEEAIAEKSFKSTVLGDVDGAKQGRSHDNAGHRSSRNLGP